MRKGKLTKIWGIIYPPLLYLAIQIVVANIIAVLIVIVSEIMLTLNGHSSDRTIVYEIYNSVNMEMSMWTVIISAAITIFIMLYLFNKDKKTDLRMPGFVRYERVPVRKYLLILPLAVASMYAGSFISSFLAEIMPSWYSESYEQAEEALYSGSMFVQILSIVIFAPIVEELIFRGVVYNRIKRMSNKIAAAIISAVMFGVYHGNFVQGVYAFIIGLILVYSYEKYKSIAAPVLFHMSANGFSLLVTTLASDVSSDMSSQTETSLFSILFTYIPMIIITSIFTFGFIMLINERVKSKAIK